MPVSVTFSQCTRQPLPLRLESMLSMGTPSSTRPRYRDMSSVSVKGTRTAKECVRVSHSESFMSSKARADGTLKKRTN